MSDTTSAPSGWTEAERLAALRDYDILDTEPERAFDDIVDLIASLFDAPIAVVNLIDEGRQWFKAEKGLGVRETPLETSFCAHAILEADRMVVPDATKDPRFTCNPLVTDAPGLRFYAGQLLKSAEGLPLGTLCVLDTKARPEGPTEVQLKALEVLADQVMTQLNLRRALKRTGTTTITMRVGTSSRACPRARLTAKAGATCSTRKTRNGRGSAGGTRWRPATPMRSNTGCAAMTGSIAGRWAGPCRCVTPRAGSCAGSAPAPISTISSAWIRPRSC